jgi:hypothetical protein
MSNQTPTPETDDAQFGTGRVSVDFVRRLERERDEARADMMRIIIERERWRVKAEEKWAMRKELEEVLGVESAPASDEQFQKGMNRLREILSERDQWRAVAESLRTALPEFGVTPEERKAIAAFDRLKGESK